MPRIPKIYRRPYVANNRLTGEDLMFMAPSRSRAIDYASRHLGARHSPEDIEVGEYYGPYLPSDVAVMHDPYARPTGQLAKFMRVTNRAPRNREELERGWVPTMKGKDFDPEVDIFYDWDVGSRTGRYEDLRKLKGLPPLPEGAGRWNGNPYGGIDYFEPDIDGVPIDFDPDLVDEAYDGYWDWRERYGKKFK